MTSVPDRDESTRAKVAFAEALAELEAEMTPTEVLSDRLAVLAATVAQTATPTLDHDPQARYLLGWWHFHRYQVLPDGDDEAELDRAFRLWEPLLDGNPDAFPPEFAWRYNTLATAADADDAAFEIFRRYERTGDIASLDEALASLRRAVQATAVDHPDLAMLLAGLGTALVARFERTGEVADLEEAVTSLRRAEQATPVDHPDLAVRLAGLGTALLARFQRTGEVADLEEAVTSLRRAEHATPVDHPDLAMLLASLGNALLARFQRTGEVADLEEAVTSLRRAEHATPVDHPDLAMLLASLGDALRVRFEWTGQVNNLEEAIEVGRRSVQVTPADHPNLGGRLSDLGIALQARFELTGEGASLDEAVTMLRQAVQAAPVDHPHFGMMLSNLGNALRARFDRTGQLNNLEEAIEVGHRAVQVTPAGHPHLGMMLSNLGNALTARFDRTGQLNNLEEAIEVGRRSVQVTATDHPNFGVYLSNLGNALQARFERTGQVANLEEAIEVGRRAVQTVPTDHPSLVKGLSSLANALRTWFERTGEAASLEEAIQVGRRTVQIIPADHPNLGMMLSNLGNTLQARFELTGEGASLDEAVTMLRQAVQATPVDHPNLGMMLSNLGNALRARFRRTGQASNVEEAIRVGLQAVQVTPPDHPNLGGYLSNLGIALRAWSDLTGEGAGLDEAITMLRQAVQATAVDHPNLGMTLANLGIALQARFGLTGEVASLEEAIQVSRRAVQVTPADYPDLSGYLSNLGNALQTQFELTGDVGTLAECRRCYAAAWAVRSAPADVRVAAARYAADADLVAEETAHALVMVERAVELLPLLAPRHLQRPDRQHRVTSLSGLASTVAAAAIAAGRPDRAVELLEQTRGLLITDTLDTRGDLTVLHHHAPTLAADFTAVRDALDALDHSTPDQADRSQTRYRGQLLADWERLLSRVRAIPDFADFLRPPSIRQLHQTARNGPIIYIVAHAYASHALILTETPHQPVHAVPLPNLTPDRAVEHLVDLRTAHHIANKPDSRARQRITARGRIRHILAQIWDTITEPVLTYLGYTSTPAGDQPWPRLWWCPVGLTTYLPLHAAGHHPTTPVDGTTPAASGDAVIDRVISSYTPTTRALHHAHVPITAPHPPRTLVVAVSDAPDTVVLPGVTVEVECLRKLVQDVQVLSEPDGTTTRDTVLAALPRHDIAHFACHGLADWNNPTASRLVLHDHHTHPLTLDRITALHLTGAQLAYLSACSTADTNLQHTDEATHLTAAFYLAGYRAVIGTLWPVNDHASITITTAFYRHLTRNGTAPPDTTRTAQALHHATRIHRNNKPQLPDHWAAHIHTGH